MRNTAEFADFQKIVHHFFVGISELVIQLHFLGERFDSFGSVAVIGIQTDDSDTPEAVKAFAQKMKLNYQLAYADEKMMNDFLKVSKFGGIPQSFLIDREGKLRGVFLGGGGENVAKIKDSVEKLVSEIKKFRCSGKSN